MNINLEYTFIYTEKKYSIFGVIFGCFRDFKWVVLYKNYLKYDFLMIVFPDGAIYLAFELITYTKKHLILDNDI